MYIQYVELYLLIFMTMDDIPFLTMQVFICFNYATYAMEVDTNS